MADREAQQNIYSYHEMSSKVMQADRSARRRNEPTGEVEPIQEGRMGDRIVTSGKTRPSEVEAKMERAQKKRQKRDTTGGRRGDSILGATGGQTILDLGSLTGYQPSTPGSQAAYENLLVRIIMRVLGNIMCLSSSFSSQLRMTSLSLIPEYDWIARAAWQSGHVGSS